MRSAPAQNLDRRKYPRIPSDHIISYMEIDEADGNARAKDLSLGGIRFEVQNCELDAGSVIRINFWVGERPVSALGRVVHSTEIDPMTLDVGLEFIDIDEVSLKLIQQTGA